MGDHKPITQKRFRELMYTEADRSEARVKEHHAKVTAQLMKKKKADIVDDFTTLVDKYRQSLEYNSNVRRHERAQKKEQRAMQPQRNQMVSGRILNDMNDYVQTRNLQKQALRDDFSNFNRASDNIYESSPNGGYNSDGRFDLTELEYFSNYRIGVGYKATMGMEADAVRNWFRFCDEDATTPVPSNNTVYKEIQKNMINTQFKKQAVLWGAYQRAFGVGFMVKYWKDSDNMQEAPPNSMPTRFEAIPPIYMAPRNVHQSRGLTWDEELWDFTSGHLGPSNGKGFTIHRDRVEVMMTHPTPFMWRGLSVLDPISLSLTCYLNAFIYLLRGFAKFGNMTPVWHTGSPNPDTKEIDERLDLYDEFDMNGMWVMGRDDRLEFPNTNFGNGMYQALEIYKEDIAAGLSIPISHLFMRSASGGFSNGDLTADQNYMNTLANIEATRTEDYLNCWRPYYEEALDGKTLLWNLAVQRTRAQELMTEQMEIQNKLLEQQLRTARMQNSMMKMQLDLLKENKDQLMNPQEREQIETAETISDFTPRALDQEAVERFGHMCAVQSQLYQSLNLQPPK